MNFADCWEIIADHQPDALALWHDGTARTWAEFEDRASRLAGALAAAGIGPGDNIALALYNGNEYMEAQFAAFKVRAAPCNVNYRYVEAELRYLIDNSDAKAVLFDDALTERLSTVRNEVDDVRLWIHVGDGDAPEWAVSYADLASSHDPAERIERSGEDLWILYTGGTTGHPKGVMWPHESIVSLSGRNFAGWGIDQPTSLDEIPAALDRIHAAGVTPRQLAASPLMHGTSGISGLMTMFCGGAVVTLSSRSLDAAELWNAVEEVRCTSITIVGDVFCVPMVDELDRRVAEGRPVDLTSLAVVTSSGVMWSQPVKDRLLAHAHAVGSNLICHDSLGSSEGVGFGSRVSQKGGSDTTTASFALGPDAAVFTETGERVAPGSDDMGLLAVGGPIPLGYYGDPVKTAETFREIEGRRWSIPGDWATVGEDGSIHLLGRGSVSINTGGEKVYPEEVEEALKLLPEVVDVNVVGVPDPKWGSAVTAVIELVPGTEIDDRSLVDALRSTLSGYKLPKNIVRVERLFRSPNGKSDYRWAARTAREVLGIPDS